MSTTTFETAEEFEEHLKELGAKYHYSCFREHDGPTCHLLGEWYLVRKMHDSAVTQYRMTCDKYDFPRSCYKTGLAYLSGEHAVKQDFDTALQYLKKSCELGENEGCYMAGQMLKNNKSFQDALKYFEKDCDMNRFSSRAGCQQASIMHLQGDVKSSTPKDLKRAFEYAMKGCQLENPKSCVNLSIMYSKGDGVTKNDDLAKQYKDKAMEIVNKSFPDHLQFT